MWQTKQFVLQILQEVKVSVLKHAEFVKCCSHFTICVTNYSQQIICKSTKIQKSKVILNCIYFYVCELNTIIFNICT